MTSCSTSKPVLAPSLLPELRQAAAPFVQLNRWISLSRFLVLGWVCLGSTAIAWHCAAIGTFLVWTAVGAIAYGFWLVCTHDAVHQTLTGWRSVDLWLARLISWPIWWPVGVYSELHWLHHRWNGTDLHDPERTQWTTAEYAAATSIGRWYVRHQWVWNILVAGSFGLIWNAFRTGWRCRSDRPQVLSQMTLDVWGMLVLHSGLFYLVYLHGAWLRYALFWLIVEWVVGVMMQTRAHLEHYGCWRSQDSGLLTQLYATRNVNGTAWVNWLMGGLPYHAIHHAFPNIPFDQLPQAYQAIQAVLKQHHQPPLEMTSGYWPTTVVLSRTYTLIDSELET
ncbi:MAG: fatty acid desaturase [Spirulina sp. SIO3F2]|nr:fatty acid desaturase [Spirulina sp. SIO3F2]